ncbi:hypothetical protein ULMS_11160 [Patiriisocius marinistellae]|uniref:DUF4136 domain-containing protein n=2 Tax=Patiriisocius marinistellae TaxID=2494560 RepID=A0A5J4FWG8_9FLAO|nr:hypothetical protein ULMS_11160 [Patiriisocius marinistellae]
MISCGASVAVDYDKETDFTTQKTFQFFTEKDSRVNPFDTKRIETSIDSVLIANDWQRTDYNQFFVDFYVDVLPSSRRSVIGIGLGSGGGGIGIGGSVGIPVGAKKMEHVLTISFHEATTNQPLVWEGVASGVLNENATPEQKESFYDRLVRTILSKFPPKK